MDKKILVAVCILAVAILMGVSFTSVVGYSGTNSKSVRASPLFNLRTNRAIENSEDVTTCDFIGKGRQSTIAIPTINTKIAKVIEGLRGMNDDLFSKFISQFIKYAKNDIKIENTDINEIVEALYQVREKPEILNYENVFTTKPLECIFWGSLFLILLPLFVVLWIIYLLLLWGTPTDQYETCGGHTVCSKMC